MAIDVLEGPFSNPPHWQGGTVTFVRNNSGVRALGEPRVAGSFLEQMAAWGMEWLRGGTPQYWRVHTGIFPHPEVVLFADCRGGGQQFEIGLTFNVQVVGPKEAVLKNVGSLEGCFTQYLHHDILPIARRFNIAESVGLQAEIEHYFGMRFGNEIVKGSELTVRVAPKDADVRTAMGKVGAVPAALKGIEAEYVVQQAQIEAFRRQTGNMTVHDMAMAAIATSNPKLIDAYKQVSQQQVDAGQRNWEVLKWLVDRKLIEPHQLEQHLGPLPAELMKSLVAYAMPTLQPKLIKP